MDAHRRPPWFVLAALALASSAGATTSALPSLRVVDLSPVMVRGAHFVPGERVKVTLRAGGATRVRTLRTGAAGGFAVGFGMLADKDRCSGSVAVTAVGARGDRAFYKLPSMACPAMTSGNNR